jgi:two-component system, response regulator
MGDKIILLVEDNEDDVLLTKRAFQKNNVKNELVVVSDGREALDWLFGEGEHAGRDASVLPELILLDVNMPRVGGLEVLEKVRADPRTEFVPVVMLTSSKQEEDLIRSYELGANSYVRKPVAFESFVDAVRTLGVYWLVLNERARRPTGA